MRKIIITLSLILAFGINSYAQEKVETENELTYSAEEFVKIDSNEDVVTLLGNANLKTDMFEFQNADKIVINKVSNEVLISGVKKVIFKGGTLEEAPESKKKLIRYKIGEKIAYME